MDHVATGQPVFVLPLPANHRMSDARLIATSVVVTIFVLIIIAAWVASMMNEAER